MAYRDVQSASLYAEDDEITKAWEEWARQRKCIHCGAYYTTFNSFGRQQCKQHYKSKPTIYEPDGQYGEKFICCDKKLPRPQFVGPGSYVPCGMLMDQFSCTPCDTVLDLPADPMGCANADHTDDGNPWPIGLVDFKNPDSEYYVDPDLVRPVGGWKINETIKFENKLFKIRSPPNPFGEVRVQFEGFVEGETKGDLYNENLDELQGETKGDRKYREPNDEFEEHHPTELHVKDMRPYGFDIDIYDTLEIIDETTGKVADKISKIVDNGCWRRWSAGVLIPDIAGVLPFMVNTRQYPRICGTETFSDRVGVNPQIPVVWRINVPDRLLT